MAVLEGHRSGLRGLGSKRILAKAFDAASSSPAMRALMISWRVSGYGSTGARMSWVISPLQGIKTVQDGWRELVCG